MAATLGHAVGYTVAFAISVAFNFGNLVVIGTLLAKFQLGRPAAASAWASGTAPATPSAGVTPRIASPST